MPYVPKILAFAGSLRKDSWNKKLIKIAVHGAQKAGGQVTLIDLKDYPLPLYDGDIETQGIPDNVQKIKEIFMAHQGLMVACPEYNSSITAVLKNVIDWVSRPIPDEQPPQNAFKDKVGVIMSASPGALGGLRGLVHVRAILSNMNVLLLPNQVACSKAHEAFLEDGNLKDVKLQSSIEQLGESVVKTLIKLHD